MKEWTREERYRPYETYTKEEIQQVTETVANCPYRQKFHIQPPTGLLNDPNGFAYFNGAYHLFYQWFPMGPVHGLKYWKHLSSTDLVNWQDLGIGLSPDNEYDAQGVFSGSGMALENELILMYTGNVRDKNWDRTPHQIVAKMTKDGAVTKLMPPAIKGIQAGYTDHFRDPKIWQENGIFYCVVGAQTSDLKGACALYRSSDLENWEHVDAIKTQFSDFGFMWECPDYFVLDGKGVLLFSPQGIEAEGDRYHNIFETGYLIDEPLNLENPVFKTTDFHELDYGFDFYATQTTLAPDGRRIMMAWLGLPEIPYPTDASEWAHCLTLPRELFVKNGKIYQQPIQELQSLRKERQSAGGVFQGKTPLENIKGKTFELKIKLSSKTATSFGVGLRTDASGNKGTFLTVDTVKQKLIFDRTQNGEVFATEYGTIRQTDYQEKEITLHIFVDTSSVEIFVNDGEMTFTSRIFPKEDYQSLFLYSENGKTDFSYDYWEI